MHLSDCFVDLIAYVAAGVKEPRVLPESCENLARIIDDLILESEEKRVSGGFSVEDYNLARFAVFVWTDESIMKSSYPGKDLWRKYLLQRKYYKTTGGGVEFYKKLKSLELDQNQVREVYFLCLSLGYSGRYGLDGEDRIIRDRIKLQNLKHLTGTAEGLGNLSGKDRLFPQSYAEESPDAAAKGKRMRLFSFRSMVLSVLPVGVFAFLYVLYRFILDNEIMAKMVH